MDTRDKVGFFATLIYIPLAITAVIYGLASETNENLTMKTALIIFSSISLVIAIVVFASIITVSERKKRLSPEESNETLREIAKMDSVTQFPLSATSRGDNPYNSHRSTRNIDTILTNHSIDESKDRSKGVSSQEYDIKAIVFEGETKEVCQICKLELRKDQMMLKCPSCEKMFHKNHLEEWLVKTDECPVCGFKLKISRIESIDLNRN